MTVTSHSALARSVLKISKRPVIAILSYHNISTSNDTAHTRTRKNTYHAVRLGSRHRHAPINPAPRPVNVLPREHPIDNPRDPVVHDVRAPAELRDRVVLDRLAEVAARLERDARCVAGRAEPGAGAHRDWVACVVDVGDVLRGGLWKRRIRREWTS